MSTELLTGLLLLFTCPAPQDPVPAALSVPASPAAAPVLPQPLTSFGCAAQGDLVFVYGGHVGRAHAHSRQNQVGTLLRLDRSQPDAQWQEIGAGTPLQSPALVCHGGAAIRLGGMAARNAAGEAEDLWSTDEVVRFEAGQRTWSPLPALPEARSSHDATLLGSRIVVVGGWQLAGKDRRWLDTAWSLELADPAATWQPLPNAPFQRRALAVAAVGDRIYALGGIDSEDEMSSRVDVLDLATKTWARGPDLPGKGFAVAAVAHEGKLYASGRDGDLWRLAGDRWDTVNALALPRFFHRLVPSGDGKLLAIGGASDRHLATCELVPCSREALHTQQWSLPWSHPARNRQGFGLWRDTLFVAGGNCGKKQHDFEPQHFTAQCTAIDLRTMQVESRADMPAARQSLGMLAVGDRLLAIGGFAHTDGGGRSQASGFTFAPKENTWTPVANLPEPRTQFGFAKVDGGVWVLGGIDYAPDRKGTEFLFLPTVLRSDGEGGPFAAVPTKLPRARRAFGCGVQDGRIWLVGGMREEFEPVTEVDVFDPATNAWTTGPAPAHARISPFLLALGDSLVLAGGSEARDDGLAPARTLAVLPSGAAAWQELDLPLEPPLLGAVAWRERLLLVSRAADRLVLTAVQLPNAKHRP